MSEMQVGMKRSVWGACGLLRVLVFVFEREGMFFRRGGLVGGSSGAG
ncbi:hypothetical protein [Bartonella tribocorum]|nr:hypothetical protein [Bartonella tribocorum]